MKKLLSALLAIAIVSSLLPTGFLAASAITQTACMDFYSVTEKDFAIAADDHSDAVEAITNTIQLIQNSINILSYSITFAELTSIMNTEIRSNPSFFYLDNAYGYSSSSGYISDVYFHYNYTPSDINTMRQQYENEITKALACVNISMSEAEKVMTIHDYIILHAMFDKSTLTNPPDISYTAYGIMVNGVGVCEGYVLVFLDLMKRLNISVEFVSSASMHHAWNMVKVDGLWYHIDLTWDDPIFSAADGWLNNDYDLEGNVEHQYFLISDTAITSTAYGHSSDWAPHINATSSIYYEDYIHITSGMFYKGGDWYYINNGNIIRSSFALNSSTGIKAVNSGRYSYLGVFNNEIYYNITASNNSTSQIRKCNFDGSSDTQVLQINNAGQTVKEKITELVIQNSRIKYTVYRWPSANPSYDVRYFTLTAPPAVYGVAEGMAYNASVIITFDNGLTATLNGTPFNSGATVSTDGTYTIIVTDPASGLTTTMHFTIDSTAPSAPTFTADTSTHTINNVPVTIVYPMDATVKQYNIDGGVWTDYTEVLSIPVNCIVNARCADAAGNFSNTSSLTVSNIDDYVRINDDKGADTGDTFLVKVPWYGYYRKISPQLGFTSNVNGVFNVEWSSSDTSKVTINQTNGKITNTKSGPRAAIITIKLTDINGTAIATDTVKIIFYKYKWQLNKLNK